MTHQVFMTNDARDDLIDIIEYIQSNDSKDSADYVLEQIETTVKTLSKDPERGSHPRELVKIGILQY